MVVIRCKNPVEYNLQKPARDPVVLFDLESLGVNTARFLADLAPSFEELEWDYYDVRREQMARLLREGILEKVPTETQHRFYSSGMTLPEFLGAFADIPSAMVEELQSVKPYRRRTTAKLDLRRTTDGRWATSRLSNRSITQAVPNADYRSLPRQFPETSVHVLDHPDFVQLVHALGGLVQLVDSSVRGLQLTCWQTGIVATAHRAGSNSPEGVHQDGADYIVSALVTDRRNIDGGTSRVFGPDKQTEHLTVTLGPGQGVFQADAGSSLWHDVTPIKVQDPSGGPGKRNLFGFDINVIERE